MHLWNKNIVILIAEMFSMEFQNFYYASPDNHMIFLWIYSFFIYQEEKKLSTKSLKFPFCLVEVLQSISSETSTGRASWVCTHFGGRERGRGGTAQKRSPRSSQHLLVSHSAPQLLAEHPQPVNHVASFQKLLLRQTLQPYFRTIHFSNPDISFSKDYWCSKLES